MHQCCCYRRTPPDVEVEDLFSEKPEPLDVDRPDCGDGGTIPGLSARDPEPNLSPNIQQKRNELGWCTLIINHANRM